MRAVFRSLFDRLMAMTRILPAVGFGRTPDPPTAPIGRSGQLEPTEPAGEMHDQQHVEVPSRAVGKRPQK